MRLALLTLLGCALSLIQACSGPEAASTEARRSGYHFMGAATRALQDDDTQNPAFLWVADGQRRFEAEKHDWVRTVRLEIAVPRVIRLMGYDRLPAQTVKLNRRNLFARDRNTCQYCGRHFPTSELSIDHVLPRSLGGGDSWENLVCACIKCNARKGGRTPEQARMKLIRRPVMPKRNPLIQLRLGQDKYSSWRAFLDHAYWSVELK